jgi:hypothetical protein
MSGNLIPSSGPQPLEPSQEMGLQVGEPYDVPPPDAGDGVQWGRYISALKRYRWSKTGVAPGAPFNRDSWWGETSGPS